MLEACGASGASRVLQPIPTQPKFTPEQRRNLRISGGCESSSGFERFADYTLRGLDQLLTRLPDLDAQMRSLKARLLWEALGELQERRGAGVFVGVYHWSYYQARSAPFDASFVQQLNNSAWIPTSGGGLETPLCTPFEDLGWKTNPFLQAKIKFKPPVIEMLAKEAGIEPGVLDLLRKLGVTSEAELRSILRVEHDETPGTSEVGDDAPSSNQEAEDETADNSASQKQGEESTDSWTNTQPTKLDNAGEGNRDLHQHGESQSHSQGTGVASRKTDQSGSKRTFISYVAASPDDDEGPDPDGLEQEARIQLEERAIAFILGGDDRLQRTPKNNRGFDLFESDGLGLTIRWVEVKAMRGGLEDRPVCLTRAQFDCAWVHGESYWLYIVEHAGDDGRIRLLRIQDPSGKARHFTFDSGWRLIADK